MDRHVASEPRDLADVLAADAEGRARALERVDELAEVGGDSKGPGSVRPSGGREAGVGKSGVTAGHLERDHA